MQLIESRLSDLVLQGVRAASASGALPEMDLPETAPIARAKRPEWGDFSSPIAMQLAKLAQRSPIEVAEAVHAHLPAADLVGSASVSPPGFVNFTLSAVWLSTQVERVLAKGAAFADLDLGTGRSAQVEYVSANPTGPLTVGHGRTGVIGDTMASLLQAAGFDVTREYYYNNAGKQMRALGASLKARYLQALGQDAEVPEGGYEGAYLTEMGKQLAADRGSELAASSTEAFKDIAEAEIGNGQRATMARLGIKMDVFFNEASLYESNAVWDTLDALRDRGFVYDADGATWFKATALGGPEDRVVVRSNGEPTYRLPDIAYHADKLSRGFDLIVDVLGADHKDAFPDVVRGIEALGHDTSGIKLLMNQFVTIKGGRMSKRQGRFTTLDELMDEVGSDVTRFFLLMRSAESHLEFDLDLALEASDKNPVYYVQYAHARICSILRLATERGVSTAGGDVVLLRHEQELAVMRRLVELPATIKMCVDDLAPHHLTTYGRDLASDFHSFYRECRVLDPEAPELSSARLMLVDAVRIGLARTLELIGVSAPESM